MPKFLLACICALIALTSNAYAHAIVGDRIFPATLAIDDPGVSDELTLPEISRFKDGSDKWSTDTSAEFDKRITDNFALSVSGAWIANSGYGQPSGLDNIGAGAKYVFYTDAPHEVMLSTGLDVDIQNTGARRIADSFSTVTPAVFFGKGMGDLPDSMDFAKPFAITGSLGYAMPTRNFDVDPDSGDKTRNLSAAEWGFSLQYSIPYLQQHVKDIGLEKPFSNAIPLVEFAFETPTGGVHPGRTTGTANPGVIFMGSQMQIGLEAQLPLNRDSGRGIGYLAQLHFYLDDIFPKTLGRPIW